MEKTIKETGNLLKRAEDENISGERMRGVLKKKINDSNNELNQEKEKFMNLHLKSEEAEKSGNETGTGLGLFLSHTLTNDFRSEKIQPLPTSRGIHYTHKVVVDFFTDHPV